MIYIVIFQYTLFFKVRAINVGALLGNISGYIGFFLGYTLLQLPNLTLFLYRTLRGYVTFQTQDKTKSAKVKEKMNQKF